jgi:hypothetical protein
MMENKNFFIYLGQQNSTAVLEPFEVKDRLPYPLNAEPSTIWSITQYLTINLLLGGILRSKILKFAKSLSIKENPINLFIWYDQVSIL